MSFERLLCDNPVIAAVKDKEELDSALKSSCDIIFVLFGDLISIKSIGEKIAEHKKIGILHIDLVEGMSNKEIVIKYLKEETKFSGIISTKTVMVKFAKKYGLIAVQRVFVYDSISFNNAKSHIASECDAVEVLPGVIEKVIKDISLSSKKPVIAGGLVECKDEVIKALNAGAACVSTTKEKIWNE